MLQTAALVSKASQFWREDCGPFFFWVFTKSPAPFCVPILAPFLRMWNLLMCNPCGLHSASPPPRSEWEARLLGYDSVDLALLLLESKS